MSLSYRALLLDLSGVLYEGSQVIPGAAEVVAQARKQKIILRFVTNTATKNSADIRAGLTAMGIEVAEEELFTAPVAARNYIVEQHLRPFSLLHPALESEFSSLNQKNPNCVLMGDARDALNYDSLNQAFQLCMKGAPLIGIGMNKYFKDDDGLKLDAGGFIRLVEWAADSQAIIMGKPNLSFYQQVVTSTTFAANECLMIGDDVETDVLGAVAAGLQGCLVRTGKYQKGEENILPPGILCIDSIRDLPGLN